MNALRLWTLREIDAAVLVALRDAHDNLSISRSISVSFTGSICESEYFQLTMVSTGWEIREIIGKGENATIVMDWYGPAEDEFLKALCAHLRKIEDAYGVAYQGWAISPAGALIDDNLSE